MSQTDSSGKIQQLVEKTYGARVRLRISGIITNWKRILLVKNIGVGENGFLWAPPGGEVIFGEGLKQALEREVFEETGVLAKTERFLFMSEYIQKPFHAVEVFFLMEPKSFEIKRGSDPEVGEKFEAIGEVKWLDFDEIENISTGSKHGIFKLADSLEGLLKLEGFAEVLKP